MHTNHQTIDASSSETAPIRPTNGERKLTGQDILQRIDMLIGETSYLREGVDALAKLESHVAEAYSPGDIGTQAKAMAIASVVENREETNQKLIDLLQRMYDDVSTTPHAGLAQRQGENTKLVERLIDQSAEMSDDMIRMFLEKLT